MHKAIVVLSLFISCFFFGCDSDSDRTPVASNRPLVEIQLSRFVDEGQKGYLIITDLDGNILYNQEFANFELLKPVAEAGFTGQVVNVYLVILIDSYYYTRAFLNIKRGSYWDMTPRIYHQVNSPIKLNFNDMGDFDYLSYGTNYYSSTVELINDTIGRTKFNWMPGGKIYAQVVSDGNAKYEFFDIDPAKESFDINLSSLANVSKKHVITFPNAKNGGIMISGIGDWNTSYPSLFERQVSGSSAFVYYPDIFNEYRQILSISRNDKFYTFEKTGDIVADYPLFDANAEIIESSPLNFKATFSGDNFDYYHIEFQEPGISFMDVIAPYHVDQFQILDFPSIIGGPKLNFVSSKWTKISLCDIDDVRLEKNEFDFNFLEAPKGSMMRTVRIPFEE